MEFYLQLLNKMLLHHTFIAFYRIYALFDRRLAVVLPGIALKNRCIMTWIIIQQL